MKKIYWKIHSLIGSLYTLLTMGRHLRMGKNTTMSFCDGHSISGGGNNVYVGDGCQLYDCSFVIKGKNNIVRIGKRCRFSKDSFWISGDNNLIEIGDDTTSAHHTQFAALEGTKIIIGKDCMFSHDILVRTSDSHSIVDMEGKRINRSQDIMIGNHCWIGLQSLIMKGSSMADNSVLAARSILNKRFDETDCIIGGSPATILKREVNWDRRKL